MFTPELVGRKCLLCCAMADRECRRWLKQKGTRQLRRQNIAQSQIPCLRSSEGANRRYFHLKLLRFRLAAAFQDSTHLDRVTSPGNSSSSST